MTPSPNIPPLDFFSKWRWLDERPLLQVLEPYRQRILTDILWTLRADGTPQYNLALCGRAKKNWKSSDLILAGLYRFLAWKSVLGNDCYLLANDQEQAGNDLEIVKKLLAVNPVIDGQRLIGGDKNDPPALRINQNEIIRLDNESRLKILPARDAAGAHGKTALFIGFDEIHGYRNWDLFEALALDPHRADALQMITSYDTLFNHPGIPLVDMKSQGRRGDDPRMYFSWYSAGECSDPEFANLPPDERANPSMSSWPEGRAYIDQQRRRLPSTKFRRLHHNLPGAPSGAFYDPDKITAAIVVGRTNLPPEDGVKLYAGVDMSGGSSDDAVLSLSGNRHGKIVQYFIGKQRGQAPFNPRHAVTRFAGILRRYGIRKVCGDRYAGQTFRADFEEYGIQYEVCGLSKSDLYEELEPQINAGEIELLDHPKLLEQFLTLIVKGGKIDHMAGDHDDFANAAALSSWLASKTARQSLPFISHYNIAA